MPSDGLPASTEVGRVSLRVADSQRVAAFYESVVGLERVGSAAPAIDEAEPHGPVAHLGVDDRVLVHLVEDPEAPARTRAQAGLFHLAIRVPSREALGDALERAADSDALTGASDHHVSEALYLRDPEGNGVEIYRDRPREEWPTENGRVQMDTLPLDTDSLREEATGARTVPPETDIGHVHLEVTAIPNSREFYVDDLGMNVRQEWGPSALFVAAGDYHHHVGLNTWNGRTEPAGERGLDWFELLLPDEGELEDCRARLEDAGWEVVDRSEGFAVHDPDDIGLRVRSEG